MATSFTALGDYINTVSYRWVDTLRYSTLGPALWIEEPSIVTPTIKDSPLLCRTVDTLYKPQ